MNTLSYKEKAREECVRARAGKVLVGYDDAQGKCIISRSRCKQWDCPSCAARKVLQIQFRIANGVQEIIENGQSIYFATFTLNGHTKPTKRNMRYFGKAWNSFNLVAKRWCYEHGLDYCYALIPEASPTNQLHAHAFITSLAHKTRWNDELRHAGLGWSNDFRELDTPGLAAWYATKYMSKSLAGYDFPPRTRKVRYSKNFPKPPDKRSGLRWEIHNQSDWRKERAIDILEHGYKIIGEDLIYTPDVNLPGMARVVDKYDR